MEEGIKRENGCSHVLALVIANLRLKANLETAKAAGRSG
jgi:hypothetical protein